jgi:hypothetical protein
VWTKRLSWPAALTVFLVFFGVYSFRLGVEPIFWHDDYEYTYPSFSLAERGNFGSPLLGTAFNVQNRTYHFTIYYYATVHAALIRLFGDGPESIPLANTFHFALLAAIGSSFLVHRGAILGVAVFLFALVSDEQMIAAARHGRPEMTAGCCLMMGVLALWLWHGEGRHRPAVMFALGSALTAAILSHTAVLFFAAALGLAFTVPLLRTARPLDVAAGLLPFATIPLLFGYFILTDSVTNVWLQLGPQEGNVIVGRLLAFARHGEWDSLAGVTAEFLRTHVGHPSLWLGVAAALTVPAFAPSRWSRGARFLAAVYSLSLVVHFLFLKHFVLSYRVIYQATLFMTLALLAEAFMARLGERYRRPAWVRALRIAGVAVLLLLTVRGMSEFREQLHGRPHPYAELRNALVAALADAGAEPGDRVFVPGPFAFHLRQRFDVTSYPPNWRYFQGHWGPAFREGVRGLWGAETLARLGRRRTCWAMGLAYRQPEWVLSWNFDLGVFRQFRRFLRWFPEIPGVELEQIRRVGLPPPYGGRLRVFRLELSDGIRALDRAPSSTEPRCP